MRIRKKTLFIAGAAAAVVLGIAGIAYAAFSDRGKVLGSSFSVGNADIKLFNDVAQGSDETNLKDEINGPSFTNIGQNWHQDYPIKIYNNGTYKMALASYANYETVNDPDDLRQYLYAEIFKWDDADSDGVVDENELLESLGRKTIIKWKTEGFNMGEFDPGQVLPFVIRFSTENISDTKQGVQGIYDFEFESIEM